MNQPTFPKPPDSAICSAASQYVRSISDPFLFNHVARSFAFGDIVGRRSNLSYDRELLYLGAILHDVGLTAQMPGNDRFEIEGADAAQVWLSKQGMDDNSIDIVWDAIALHTTMGVPQRKRPEIALVQAGAAVDVGVIPVDVLGPAVLDSVLQQWPRLDFKRAMIAALDELATRNSKSLGSHVVAEVAERLHGIERFNICDAVHNSAFDG